MHRAIAAGDGGLAVADFDVEVEAVASGDGALGHVDAHAGVRRLQDAAVGVEDAVGAGDDRAVAVEVERELPVLK